MPREGGASSTLQPLGSTTDVSGILGRPLKAGDDERTYRASCTLRRKR
jgi:hypothetical protein